ncbi:MAG: hypothetical protein K5657_01945 [Desulfovibrio sp.]|nr:hypothetical protein [Desulfovibrio sp.]
MNGINGNLQAANQVHNANQNPEVPDNLQQNYENVANQQNFENLQGNQGGSSFKRTLGIIGGILATAAGFAAMTLATCGIGTAVVFFGGLLGTAGGLTLLTGSLASRNGHHGSALNQDNDNNIANNANDNPVMHADNNIQNEILNQDDIEQRRKDLLNSLRTYAERKNKNNMLNFFKNIFENVQNLDSNTIKTALKPCLTQGTKEERELARNALENIQNSISVLTSDNGLEDQKNNITTAHTGISALLQEADIKEMFVAGRMANGKMGFALKQ